MDNETQETIKKLKDIAEAQAIEIRTLKRRLRELESENYDLSTLV